MTVEHFRTRPELIKAEQVRAHRIPSLLTNLKIPYEVTSDGERGFAIRCSTSSGADTKLVAGDWLLWESSGDLTPMPDKQFQERFEQTDSQGEPIKQQPVESDE